eukprot:3297153-Rhodomonas_salina.2
MDSALQGRCRLVRSREPASLSASDSESEPEYAGEAKPDSESAPTCHGCYPALARFESERTFLEKAPGPGTEREEGREREILCERRGKNI